MAAKHIPAILDGKFFRIIQDLDSSNVVAQCITCEDKLSEEPISKVRKRSAGLIKGSLLATSNFLKHLKSHPAEHEEYKEYLKSSDRRKTPNQPSVSTFFSKVQPNKASLHENLIMDYIIESMSPLYHVEESSFKRLITGLNPDAKSMSYKRLCTRIDDRFVQENITLEKNLSNATWVCCTADLWSSRRRSFLGVTCHWITPDYKRESAVIAFKRFRGSHTYEKIAEVLDEAFKDVKLPSDKIVCCMTDNGSNYIKAFKEYGIKVPSEEEGVEDFDEEDGDDELVHVGTEGLSTLSSEEISLPLHLRCGSHTLSLVATEDFIKPLKKKPNETQTSDPAFKKVFPPTMAKCSGFWNKLSRSNKIAEEVYEIVQKTLGTPCVTRWNSLFDCISELLKYKEKLNEVFEKAGVMALSRDEVEFLEDYAKCMDPVAKALDKLQNENTFLFGYFAPAILQTKRKLEELARSAGTRKHLKTMADLLKARLEKRFQQIFAMDYTKTSFEMLSAMTLPYFKLRWVPADQKDSAKAAFIAEAKRFCNSNKGNSNVVLEETKQVDDFFSFEPESDSTPLRTDEALELECLNYFQDPSDSVKCLDKYPTVKAMFFYFNTPLASSAPVERLFCYVGLIFSPRRARLSDEMFKKLVFLKLCRKNPKK